MNTEEENVDPIPTQQWTATQLGIEIIGWLGAASLIFGYYLIQNNKVDHDNKLYMALNILGSFCLLINTWSNKAYPSSVTNFIWLVIGSISAYKIFYHQEGSS